MVSNMPHLSVIGLQKSTKRNSNTTTKKNTNHQTLILKKKRKKYAINKLLNPKLKTSQSSYDVDFIKLVKCIKYAAASIENTNKIQHNFRKKVTNERKAVILRLQPSTVMLGPQIAVERRSVNIIELCPICRKEVMHIDNDVNESIYNSSCSQKHQLENIQSEFETHSRINQQQHLLDFYSRKIRERMSQQYDVRLQMNSNDKIKCFFGTCISCEKSAYLQKIHGIEITEPNVREQSISFTNCVHQQQCTRRKSCCHVCRLLVNVNINKKTPMEILPAVPHAVSYSQINNIVTYANAITTVPERITIDKRRFTSNAHAIKECTEKCDYKNGKFHCLVTMHHKISEVMLDTHHTNATANVSKSFWQNFTTKYLSILQFVFVFLQILQFQSNNFQKITTSKRQQPQQLPLQPQQQQLPQHKQQQERGSSSIRLITYFLNSYNHTNNNNNINNSPNSNNINNSKIRKGNQQQKLLPSSSTSSTPIPPQLQHYQIKETQKTIYYHYIKNKNKKICKTSSTFSLDEDFWSTQTKDLNDSDTVHRHQPLQNTAAADAVQYTDEIEKCANSTVRKTSENYRSILSSKSLKRMNSTSSTKVLSVFRLEHLKKITNKIFPKNIVIFLTFLMFLLPVTCAQTSLSSSPAIKSSSTRASGDVRLAKNEVVCQSMDVRNSPLSFSALKNCTVIEGFLLFTLINTKGQEEFNETYPLLVEVTEYVIVYRVHKLRSLGQLFPNLAIIRGEELFLSSYALVVFSNPDLLELGLTKLTAIPRGGVRLQGNKNLCFANTIDWHEITSDGSEIKIKDNRPTDDCPRCPGSYIRNEEVSDSDRKEVMFTCKESSGIYPCWNSTICQTICPRECPRNCFNESTCCNPACLGGCTNNPNHCASCRHFSINNTTCIDECPPDTFNYLNRRCISAETCKLIKKRYYGNKETELVAFQGTCSVSCPPKYKLVDKTCVHCGGTCRRVCEGAVIDDITRAKQFEGCTEIVTHGLSISIKIGGSHVTDALRKALSSIETIRTYLKVHNTYGMGSLSFFENLKSIGGEKLLDDKFALYVLENNDLSEIWGANRTVNIENGTIYFHFNPKLCVNKIKDPNSIKVKNSTQITTYEVSDDSNGSKVTCDNTTLNATVKNIESDRVTVVIENPPEIPDQRTFIGYQLLLMIDEHKNATKFTYGPCEDKWNITEPYKTSSTNITGLLPYTQYAFYIRSKTISWEKGKGNPESPISYFKTKSSQPKPVRAFKAYAITDTEISISWLPPRTTNGKLVNYIVSIKIDNRTSADTRDYCKLVEKPDIEIQATTKKPPVEVPAGKCEVVPDSQNGSGGGRNRGNTYVDDEKEIDEFIYFENAVQNLVFLKRSNPSKNEIEKNLANKFKNETFTIDITELIKNNAISSRRRRNLDSNADQVLLSRLPREVKTDVSLMDETGRYYKEITKNVSVAVTKYTFKALKPFSRYYVSVEACREPEQNASGNECSNTILYDVKTLKKENVDIVRNFEATFEGTNSSGGMVRVRWDPPEFPNGDVVSYTIESQLDAPDAALDKRCITQKEYLKQKGYFFTALATGNYSIRVRANTLAGNGIFTAIKYVYIKPLQLSAAVIALIAVGVLVVALCLIGSGMLMRKKFLSPQLDLIMNPTINPDYLMQPYIPDDWEVPRERIIQLNPLGQGSFGMVYEGLLKSYNNSTEEDILCAIKTTNEHATDRERANFLEEASVMKQFDTHHVVRLLGVCSLGQPALVIMELMRNGDLKSYLRAHRPDEQRGANGLPILTGGAQPPPLSRIYQMAIEIADGMAYLAAKKFVHRDLAARNCMVAADLTVKIGDFGMTRDIYETDYYRKGTKGLLPVRWMPPESLRDGVYSNASDVFSYGVVLWEMATLAAQPYQGYSNDQVLHHVIDGGVMERPDNCSDRLYSLMQKCWLYRPSARPTFMEIIRMLYDMADPRFEEVSFYNSPEGQQQLNKELLSKAHQPEDIYDDRDTNMDDATTPLHIGDYSGYKLDMANNSSIEHQDESPMITCDDNLHSPYSLGSVMIVNSASDGQSKNSFSLSQKMNNPNIGVGGVRGPPPQYSSVSNIKHQNPTTHNQYKSLQGQYHQSDDNGTEADDGGYQIYDPSPNYQEHRPYSGSGDGNVNDLVRDVEDFGSSRGGQNLLPSHQKSSNRFPTIMSMSSSMPDDIIRGGTATPMVSSSLHLSTASAASSNASSTTGKLGKSFVPKRLNNLFTSKHKRSGSNSSHKSTGSNIQTSGAGESNNSSSGGGVNSGKPALSTIESGGSGSAGSYCITPPNNQNSGSSTANTAGGGGGGYKLLDETANVSGLSDQFVDNKSTNESSKAISTKTSETTLPKPSSVFKGLTTSANTNYQLLNKLSNTFSDETDSTINPTYMPIIDASENPNYVMMNEPFKRPDNETTTAAAPSTTPSTTTTTTTTTTAASTLSSAGAFEVGNISVNPNYLTAAPNPTPMKSPPYSVSSITDDDDDDDEDLTGEDSAKDRQIGEQIPMIPLQQHQQPRILPGKSKNLTTTKPAASLLHRKQKQVRKPPPNGFIGPETT